MAALSGLLEYWAAPPIIGHCRQVIVMEQIWPHFACMGHFIRWLLQFCGIEEVLVHVASHEL